MVPLLFARHFHIGAERIMLAGFLVGIIAFQLLLQRVVLLPADETLLVRCLRRSLQTFGQHFAFACENGVLRALTGNVIVRCSWFYPPRSIRP